MLIEVYSDGSSLLPRKPGGYGWLIAVGCTKIIEGNGWLRRADNNDAEVEGAFQGLSSAIRLYGREKPFVICSDSRIILGWIDGTYRFKNRPKNLRFLELQELVMGLDLSSRWIRAHSGDQFNERCDELATMGRNRQIIL